MPREGQTVNKGKTEVKISYTLVRSPTASTAHLQGHTQTHNRGFCVHGWNQPQIEKRGDTRCSELNLQMEGRKSCIDTRLCPTLNCPLLCKTGFLHCVFPWETPCPNHPSTLEGGGRLCCASTGEHHLCDTARCDKDIPGRRQGASLWSTRTEIIRPHVYIKIAWGKPGPKAPKTCRARERVQLPYLNQ